MKKVREYGAGLDEIVLPFRVTIRTVFVDGEREILTNRLQKVFVRCCKATNFRQSVLLTYKNHSILLEKVQYSILLRKNPELGQGFSDRDDDREYFA